jgi:hypothetical protein
MFPMKKTKKKLKLKKDETFNKKQVAGMLIGVLESFDGLLAVQIALQKQVDLLRQDMEQALGRSRSYVWSLNGEKLG